MAKQKKKKGEWVLSPVPLNQLDLFATPAERAVQQLLWNSHCHVKTKDVVKNV